MQSFVSFFGQESHRFGVRRQLEDYLRTRDSSLHVHGRGGMEWRGMLAVAVALFLFCFRPSAVRPPRLSSGTKRGGRDWNELVREQMEQRRPRATPGLSRL